MSNPRLLEAIAEILHKQQEGLNEREIRRSVVSGYGLRARPADIRRILQTHPEQFVGPLADGRWRLRRWVETEATVLKDVPAAELRDERGEVTVPFLAHLPPLDSYIVFDLETTGLHAGADQIIQISAVRMTGGQPAAAETDDGEALPALFDAYVHPGGRTLAYGLKAKLGFVQHPEWEQALYRADNLATVLAQFRRWAGDLPLVAHNARFDASFLQAAAASQNWPLDEARFVDTMELALLARPDLSTYRLEQLAAALAIDAGSEGGREIEAWAAALGVDAFTWSGFHNAVVDVLVLAAIVPRLLDTLRQRFAAGSLLGGELARLFPTLARQLGNETPATQRPREEIVVDLVGEPEHPEALPPLSFDFAPGTVAVRFRQMIATNGLKQRASQLQMVEEVCRALQEERVMLIEAPTGTGKTFAYLVPAVLWARSRETKVFIATHTRLLQDQMAEDLERLRRTLEFPFRAQRLKGKENYLCLSRTAALYAQTILPQLDDEERFAWLVVLSWLAHTREGLLDEISYWAISTFPAVGRLLSTLRTGDEGCYNGHFHALAYERAAAADIVIVNHALLLAKEWTENSLPLDHLIIDEAHNLEDVATDAITQESSWETIMPLVNQMLDQRSGQGTLIRLKAQIREAEGLRLVAVALQERNLLKELTIDFGNQLRRYLEKQHTAVDPRYGGSLSLVADPRRTNPASWPPVERAREKLTESLREAESAIKRLSQWLEAHPLPAFRQETRAELAELAFCLGGEAKLLESLLRVGYDPLVRVHWIEVRRAFPLGDGDPDAPYHGPYRWAVKQAPVRVGPYLEKALYTQLRSLVLTSATLRTTLDAGFGFMLDRLGLKDRVQAQDARALPPELDYSRALFGIARYMRADARPAEIQNFVDEVSQELGWLFRFTGGNGLGLFTARVRMREVHERLEPVLGAYGIPVWHQDSGSRRGVLEELQTRPGTVVLGLKSFWEGVDVPGPNLCYVIMEKLPFPMLSEPVVRARAAELRARDGHEFSDYVLPLMLISFKQGFGRLIRSETDVGAVLLLDKRVWNREYRRDLLAALPGLESRLSANPTARSPRLLHELLEDEGQRSRRAVYEAIARHMTAAPPEWQVDVERLQRMLEEIPDELLTSLEQLLGTLRLPDVAAPDQLRQLWERVLQAIIELFHFDGWRIPEQQAVVEALLLGRDALVVLPTGSGKSFTFQLPALLREGTTLVFSPLKALMKDQVDKLLDRGLTVADRIDSSQSAEEQERVYIRMREGTTRLVYIAPERIRDPRLQAALAAAKNIVQVVVDEAHCVHMWGQNFRPDFLYIARLVETIAAQRGRRPPVAALTATATPRVRQAIAEGLQLQPNFAQIERNPNRPELRLVVYNNGSSGFRVRSKRDKDRLLLRILRSADRRDENAIVYVATTRQAERLSSMLERNGLEARHYHGRLDDQARKDVQDLFLEGQVKTIIATKAFGMGVDKPDIRYVIHYEMPGDIESYFQEAGRAGRDGAVSWAVLLYHKSDLRVHENFFIPNSLPDPEQVGAVLAYLQAEARGQQTLYVDPRSLAADLGLDETQLGIHLHVLESLGYFERGVDVTLLASARLLAELPALLAEARRLAPPALAAALQQAIQSQGLNSASRETCYLLTAARAAEVPPLDLDNLFYQLALRGHLIYRAYGRAFTLLTAPAFHANRPLRLDADAIGRLHDELNANLAAMRHYASGLRGGDCLREEILAYLGHEKPLTPRDGCCALCDVNLAVPWATEPAWEDLTDPTRFQDVKYAVLQAVAWNSELDGMRGRAPYGDTKLAYLMLGNDYQATSLINDEQRRRRQQQQLRESPHFGVLEGLKGQKDAVFDVLDELRREGFAAAVSRQSPFGEYLYSAPTTLGRERLREGKLFT